MSETPNPATPGKPVLTDAHIESLQGMLDLAHFNLDHALRHQAGTPPKLLFLIETQAAHIAKLRLRIEALTLAIAALKETS